jgi:glucose/arabinose dehydrogenase
MDFRPGTTELWGMDMGRNNLGPDLPPEELNHIEADNDYGWPYCYGDREPDPAYNDPARCLDTTAPRYTFPAHWAPIGFVFYDYTRREPDEDDEDEPDVGFPAAYTGDALVAFHGSGPDQVEDDRIGYKVVRVYFHEGEPLAHEDLLRGFVAEGEVWGRPTGLLVAPDGSLLMSDDFGGRIFRISYVGN